MSGKRFVVALLVLVAVVVSGIYCAGMAIDLADTISPEDYLAKLNDNDTYGCKNSVRVHPDVIVFGDSHAYTGLDFNILANALGTKRIAGCTLGSMFIESVLFALKHYESLGALPQTVIFATSTRQFWEEHNKEEMLFSHKSQINAINKGDLLFSVQNIAAFFRGRDSHAYEDLRHRIKVHTPLVEGMSEAAIARVLDLYAERSPSLDGWLRRIREAEFTDESRQLIREVGEIVERNGTELIVVAIPESPWLEKQYPKWIREKYYELLDAFRPFSKAVLIYTAEDVGLGNRHFINRSLKSGYDYARWNARDFEGGPDMNADHMGGVGAVLFSRRLAEDLAEIRGGATAL